MFPGKVHGLGLLWRGVLRSTAHDRVLRRRGGRLRFRSLLVVWWWRGTNPFPWERRVRRSLAGLPCFLVVLPFCLRSWTNDYISICSFAYGWCCISIIPPRGRIFLLIRECEVTNAECIARI